jgi:hypothetical protein
MILKACPWKSGSWVDSNDSEVSPATKTQVGKFALWTYQELWLSRAWLPKWVAHKSAPGYGSYDLTLYFW